MKKSIVICAAMCAAVAFTSCKSSESAYRKAYDAALAQGGTTTTTSSSSNNGYGDNNDIPVVTPLTENPVTDTRVTDNNDNVPVRTENLSVVDGSGLRNFSVVVGSFSVKANAESLVQRLRSQGLDAQLAYNSDRGMYRVVASTYDDKSSAVASRNSLRNTYADAWLLYKGR
ncbi:MAG: SPOR domain-containing protein [Prevotella sp.]|nr:SPOR domain-containing protein [Prevotella sp.]